MNRSNYFDVIFNYVNDIGFENSVNLFLPIITKIVSFDPKLNSAYRGIQYKEQIFTKHSQIYVFSK